MSPAANPAGWFDIGVNLLDKRFNADRDDVVARAHAAGVHQLLITGTDLASATAAARYCAQHQAADTAPDSKLASTAGVHPHNADDFTAATQAALAELLAQPQVRAVGETGLDYNRNFSTPANQRAAFVQQIELAVARQLPLFVHDRDSDGEVAELLERNGAEPSQVVVHCFTGDAKTLAAYNERGYYIGITGWVADPKRGQTLRQLVPTIPPTRLLLETDAPYLWPRNAPDKPKGGRNEPSYLPWVAQQIAAVSDWTMEDLASTTTANARRLFYPATAD